MTFSFKYIIDPEVCKTEEDPQEQLQLNVPSGHTLTVCHEQDGGVPPEDCKVAALVCYDASTLPIPLRAKRVGEFIKNGHQKISPTHIGRGSGVTL